MLTACGQLPEAWRDPPILEPENNWYMDAFSCLATCRSLGFSAGPIPWTAIVQYSDREEIENEEEFVLVIRAMDAEYLRFVKEENDKD